MRYTFNFYPTLLNAFERYERNKSPENHQELFNRINRIPEKDPELLAKFKRGISFEDAVLKDSKSPFDPKLINSCRELLPKKRKEQYKVSFVHKNIQFYGYTDIVGEKRVIDLKSTSSFKPDRHRNNYQILYLFALKSQGFQQIEFISCDGQELYQEIYNINDLDFAPFLNGMQRFSEFLLENKSLIKDKKIIQELPSDLFS